ncbi:MAG: AAA family ATPase, partial [Myxococcales bacterium]|nr:AAA family ATPase [Myxococcales bacterium]
MLKRLKLTNFKGHRSSELWFDRLSLLVGENASGKSSVLLALELLSSQAQGLPPMVGVNRFERLVHKSGAWRPEEIHLRAVLSEVEAGLVAGAGYWFPLATRPTRPQVRRGHSEGCSIDPGMQFVAELAVLQPVVGLLRTPSYTRDLIPKVGRDGANTASVV